jgi:hypothetical protein
MTSGGKAYALTGNREKDLEQYVGQRVEIVGTLERGAAGTGTATGTGTTAGTARTTGTGTATGTTAGTGTTTGTTAGTSTGTTASGTGTTSGSTGATQRFSDLQQIDVVSFRAVGGSCPQ